MSRIRVRAHAKINLALRVGPLRDDGYHAVSTVLQAVSLADVLYGSIDGTLDSEIEAADETSLLCLTVDGQDLPEDNTVTRAAAMLAATLRARGDARIVPLRLHLVKRIPSGAGLGGGSSDAVAALWLCARLWAADWQGLLRTHELARICAALGSDVPFFLTGGTALGTGRGERVEPLPALRTTWFVLAAPAISVSTPEAYAAFDEHERARRGDVSSVETPAYGPKLDDTWMGNDLAAAVAARFPAVDRARRTLLSHGAAVAQMTGSGAASFGTFANRAAAVRATRLLRAEGYWAAAAMSITADQRGLVHET